MRFGKFIILLTALSAAVTHSAKAQGLDDIPFNDIPRPGSHGELGRVVDAAIQRDRAMWAGIEAKRKSWFADHAVAGHSVKMFEDGPALREARLELIRGARRSIYLTTYAIDPDGAGKEIAEALCTKAKAGLDVRVMINYMSSKNFLEESGKLKKCGAYVLNMSQYLASIVFALHQKLLIADGEKVIIGGSGYTNFYSHASRLSHMSTGSKNPWYDMDFEVTGPSACHFHNEFQADWLKSAKEGLDYDPILDRWEGDMPTPRYYNMRPDDARRAFDFDFGMSKQAACTPTASAQGDSHAIPVYSNPYFSRKRPILNAHISAILASKYAKTPDIKLYAPYFVPGTDFVNALLWARKNGINVSVLTNSTKSNDEGLKIPIIVATIERSIPLMAAGVKVYLWDKKSTMHRKGGVFGSDISVVGSDNFDIRGQEYSSEAVLFSDDPALNSQLSGDFDRDVEGAILLTPEYVKQFMKETKSIYKTIASIFSKFF